MMPYYDIPDVRPPTKIETGGEVREVWPSNCKRRTMNCFQCAIIEGKIQCNPNLALRAPEVPKHKGRLYGRGLGHEEGV